MSDERPLRVERDGHVTLLTLDRPDARNALSVALATELAATLRVLADDRDVRAVVLAGNGKSFCAGADLAERRTMDTAGRQHSTEVIAGAVQAVRSFPAPTIAAIRGHALAGGAELALACDLRVASTDAEIGFPEVRIGIFPGAGGVQLAAALLPAGAARELLFTGRSAGAEEALRLGLVNRVVEPAATEAAALELAREIAANAPLAVRAAKEALAAMDELRGEERDRRILELRRSLDGTADYAEALAAFAERRPPRFTGT